MPRTFAAIDLDPGARGALADAGAAIRAADPSWAGEKWVAADNLHVTLAFLGEVQERSLPAVTAALAGAAASSPAFELARPEVRAVPSPKRARMLWAALGDPSGGAARLAAGVRDSLAPWLPAEASKPFAAHVTLVRARRPIRIDAEALVAASEALNCCFAPMSVAHATLYASTLTGDGPVYEILGRMPLGVS